MTKYLSRWQIGPRLYAAFGVLIVLILVVAGSAIVANHQIEGVVTDYSGIAADNALVGRLQGNALQTRIGVKDFVISGDQASIDKVDGELAQTRSYLEQALREINKPSRAEGVRTVAKAIDDYAAAFEQVTAFQAKRNEYVGTLDGLGPKLRKKLSDIMRSAFDDNDAESAYLAGVTQEKYLLGGLYVQKFLITNEAEAAERGLKELALVIDAGETLLASLQNPERRALAKEFKVGLNTYRETFDLVTQTIFQRNDIIVNTLDRLGPVIGATTEEIQLDLKADQEALSTGTLAKINQVDIILAVTALISIGLGITAAFAISRSIADPIKGMTATMVRLSEGDTGVEVPAKGQKDEIGDMAEAVEVFKQNAIARNEAEAAQRAEQAAKEARSQRIERLIADFDDKSRQVIGELSGSGEQLGQSAQSMETVASQGADNASQANTATQQASASVQSVASAITEMQSTIAEIAQQMSHADTMTRDANRDTETAVGKVNALTDKAQSIGRVADLIGDIAEQTNLLALNATIEAARAGDAGRGFAVVASEVKTLASQTTQATRDIEADIAAMQSVSSDATQSMTAVMTSIRELSNVASSIAAAMEQQSATTAEIANSTHIAAKGTADVQDAIGQVADDAKTVGSTSTDLSQSAKVIRERTASMKQSIESFLEGIRAA